jgi:hypothetical protein
MGRSTKAVEARTAQDICALAPLGPEALSLLQGQQSPADFFNALLEKGLYRDAVRFAAHLMQPAQAVWWGCVCVWEALKPNLAPKPAAALQAALRWVLEPGEPRRREAESAGKSAGVDTPAGALALAAFHTEGSMAPANLPAVAPPPGLAAQTLSAAILLAAAQGPADQKEHRLRQFLSMAIEVSQNWDSWSQLRKGAVPESGVEQ